MGWINFTGVTINSLGEFSGFASGDISGQISFNCANCAVKTDWRPRSARPQCNNSIDDDGDGKIDYPADPGCSSLDDTDETNTFLGGNIISPIISPVEQIIETIIEQIIEPIVEIIIPSEEQPPQPHPEQPAIEPFQSPSYPSFPSGDSGISVPAASAPTQSFLEETIEIIKKNYQQFI